MSMGDWLCYYVELKLLAPYDAIDDESARVILDVASDVFDLLLNVNGLIGKKSNEVNAEHTVYFYVVSDEPEIYKLRAKLDELVKPPVGIGTIYRMEKGEKDINV